MQPRQRIDAYLQYMAGTGVPRNNFAPPLWTALWSMGIYLPPPPFLSAPVMCVIFAVLGALLILVLWLVFGFIALTRRHPGHPPTLAMLEWGMAVCAGFMAIANPIYYRRMARRHGLANWSTFSGMRQHV